MKKPFLLSKKLSALLVRFFKNLHHSRYYAGLKNPLGIKLLRWAGVRFWKLLRIVTGHGRLVIPYGEGWISVDERDYMQREILVRGNYEYEVWESLCAHADSNEVLWDVGANVGIFSIHALRDPRFEVIHSFEPDPINLAVFRANLDLNVGAKKCIVHDTALSDCVQTKKIYHGPIENSGLSSLVEIKHADSFEINCSTADGIVSQSNPAPTLLKIDVEGWEYPVLLGARGIFEKNPPKAVVFEAAVDGQKNMIDKDLLSYFESRGYEVARIRRPDDSIQPRENYIAVLGSGRVGSGGA